MEPITIDLGKYLKDHSTVLVGREFGLEVSQRSGLEQSIALGGTVNVVVPANINSISPSFIEGFVGNTFLKMGASGVNALIKFDSKGSYQVRADVDEALSRMERFSAYNVL